MTKNQIAYDILSLFYKGETTDDTNLVLPQIKYWIDITRSKLIRNSINKGQSINPDIIQTIECLNVEIVDASECNCEKSGCVIQRTSLKLPTTIETNQSNLLLNVSTSLIPGKPFTIIPFSRAPYIKAGKFTNKGNIAFLHNKYLYILSDVLFDKISVSAVFQNPEDLKYFKSCSSENCYSEDSEYPMSNHMIDDLKKMVFDTNYRIYFNSQEDDINDSAGK
ncbi:MAG: hypothetical protein EKK64_02400 [Neisseriaceae bacterium]|nr:MAG: hypothetical protein EKK64_02400 [Neisseriaceae bacterium]